MGARFADDAAVAALVSSTSLTSISHSSSSLSSRSSFQRSASLSPSREPYFLRTVAGKERHGAFLRDGDKDREGGGMPNINFALNPGSLHHRLGVNTASSNATDSVPRHFTRSSSPSPSRPLPHRGRRAYMNPSFYSEVQSRSPSASRYRPQNTVHGSDPLVASAEDDDAQSKLSTYDTIIACAFAVCVLLFFRALFGGGLPEDIASHGGSPESGSHSWWQRHHAFASSREHLHAKAGVHTKENCHDSPEGSAKGIWHHAGVHADPHAHLSVDPEGHFSFGFHHDHARDHHERVTADQRERYRTALTAAPSGSLFLPKTLVHALPRFFRRSLEDSIPDIDESRDAESSNDRLDEEEHGPLGDDRQIIDDPFLELGSGSGEVMLHNFPVRVHLPSEVNGEAGAGTTKKRHRKDHSSG